MSRPEIPIDWKLADELLESGCLGTEVAARFNMHPDTFYRRVEEKFGMGFTAYQQIKRCDGMANIKHKQYQKALTGDNTMLVWVGKTYLGQKEEQNVSASIHIHKKPPFNEDRPGNSL